MPKKRVSRKIKKTTLYRKLDNEDRKKIHRECGELPQCFTCNNKIGWFHPRNNNHGMQIGHCISSRVIELRWSEMNRHPQCADCNIRHETNPLPYWKAMLNKYGIDFIHMLEDEKRNNASRTLDDLLDLYKKIKTENDGYVRGNLDRL